MVLGRLCCVFNICSCVSPSGIAGALACLGFSGPTHRCSAVELVVKWRVGARLRSDGCIGLQDSSAHVQNGCGAMVQTVLQSKGAARIKACPRPSLSDSPRGQGPSSACASALMGHTSPDRGWDQTPVPYRTLPCAHTAPIASHSLPRPFQSRQQEERAGCLQKARSWPANPSPATVPTLLLPTSASVPAPPYQHFPVLAVFVKAEEVA